MGAEGGVVSAEALRTGLGRERPTRSPTPYASRSRPCANGSANPADRHRAPARLPDRPSLRHPDMREARWTGQPGLSARSTHPRLRGVPSGGRCGCCLAVVWVPAALRARGDLPPGGAADGPAGNVRAQQIRLERAFAPRQPQRWRSCGVSAPGRMAARRQMLAPLTRISRPPAWPPRIALPSDPPGRSPRHVRELAVTSTPCSPARSARRRAAEVRRQRFPQSCALRWRSPRTLLRWPVTIPTATAASSSIVSTPSTPGRSTSPKRCSCSAAPTSDPSPENASTCRSSRKRPPKRSFRSPRKHGVTSRPPGTSTPAIAHPLSSCQ